MFFIETNALVTYSPWLLHVPQRSLQNTFMNQFALILSNTWLLGYSFIASPGTVISRSHSWSTLKKYNNNPNFKNSLNQLFLWGWLSPMFSGTVLILHVLSCYASDYPWHYQTLCPAMKILALTYLFVFLSIRWCGYLLVLTSIIYSHLFGRILSFWLYGDWPFLPRTFRWV